jgi:hypothetical protein
MEALVAWRHWLHGGIGGITGAVCARHLVQLVVNSHAMLVATWLLQADLAGVLWLQQLTSI